ncbi:YkgJ family cysteine cluster protein [Candidatus Micrarchaeota archaeon]|nr:YkgJ family cysteine cluster protein [Candidatus Micrarchaeota archaeon]
MVLPGPCTGCGAPCCKEYLITVTSFDVSRVAAETRKPPCEFASLIPAKILNLDEDTVLECYEGDFRSDFLLALNSHPCIFLGANNLCAIHDFAPYTCRTYPFNGAGRMHKRTLCGSLRLLGFRFSGPSLSAGEFSAQLKEYKELVGKWNRIRGTKQECWEFLFPPCKEE